MDFLYLHFSFSAISEHSWFVSLAFLEIPFPTENVPPRLEQIGAKNNSFGTNSLAICQQKYTSTSTMAMLKEFDNRNTSAQVYWHCSENRNTPKAKTFQLATVEQFSVEIHHFSMSSFRFVTGTDFVSSMGPPDQFPGLKGDKANGCMKDKANHARQVNCCPFFFDNFCIQKIKRHILEPSTG